MMPVSRRSLGELLAGVCRAIERLGRHARARICRVFDGRSGPKGRSFSDLLMAVGRFFPALLLSDLEVIR